MTEESFLLSKYFKKFLGRKALIIKVKITISVIKGIRPITNPPKEAKAAGIIIGNEINLLTTDELPDADPR